MQQGSQRLDAPALKYLTNLDSRTGNASQQSGRNSLSLSLSLSLSPSSLSLLRFEFGAYYLGRLARVISAAHQIRRLKWEGFQIGIPRAG
jgi:hypothetical protein